MEVECAVRHVLRLINPTSQGDPNKRTIIQGLRVLRPGRCRSSTSVLRLHRTEELLSLIRLPRERKLKSHRRGASGSAVVTPLAFVPYVNNQSLVTCINDHMT